MPIMTNTAIAKPPVITAITEDNLVKQNEVFATKTVNSHVTAPDSLLAYMEGMPWAVTFYNQIVNRDDDVREVDLGSTVTHQQYREIKTLELRVQSQLEPSYDVQSGITTVTGSAIIVQVTPNINDYFVTEAGQNKIGIFKINNLERKTYQTKSVYYIEYGMVGYIEDKPDLYNRLVQGTVETYYFVKDRLVNGLDPLLTSKQHGDSIEFRKYLKQIVKYYFTTFLDRDQLILAMPDQGCRTYDPRLVNFLMKIITSDDYAGIPEVNVISTDEEPNYKLPSVLDALLSIDSFDIAYCEKKVCRIPRSNYTHNTFLRSTICWTVQWYIYPDVPHMAIKPMPCYQDCRTFDYFTLSLPDDCEDPIPHPWNTYTLPDGTVTKYIYSSGKDGYYIFSKNFYDNTINKSLIEILARDFLEKKPLNYKLLNDLVIAYRNFPFTDQFFYGPIIILLLREAVRGFY